jgi:hypothetical protein
MAMEVLVGAIRDPNSHKKWLNLRITVSLAMEIEVSQKISLFIVGNLQQSIPKHFSVG